MKNLVLAIWLFYVFKFAPQTIDHKSSRFWRNSVSLLNGLRKLNGDTFYLFKIGRLYIRDPHAHPMKSHFASGLIHPFCWQLTRPLGSA